MYEKLCIKVRKQIMILFDIFSIRKDCVGTDGICLNSRVIKR